VPLEFDPHGSLFVIFRQPAEVVQSQGRNFPEFQTLGTVAGPWTVKFDPQRSGPESAELRDGYKFESLVDWTQRPEDAIRYYSGTAVYTTTLNVPADASAAGQKLHLDLGDVRVMARVKLNGRDLGVVWKTPFRVEITEAVQPGENALEIQVANLWPNRLIGDQSLPAEQRYTWTTWNPFSKDARLLESGLLGPVTLQASEVGRFTAGG
jgi:hypothetical protein